MDDHRRLVLNANLALAKENGTEVTGWNPAEI